MMTSPFPYAGGKSRLAPRLAALLPSHLTYVEPFAGGAHVLFHKPPSKIEVLNDLNGDVVNFFRVCQHHHEELVRHMRFAVSSRRLYELYQRQDLATLTDIQRAARFLYLQQTSYGGRVREQTYNYRVVDSTFNPLSLPKKLEATAHRLARVQLECWPYDKILERFDRPTTVFYCDPPYVGFTVYPHNFVDADFAQLAHRLDTLRGKFLLSLNDHPLTRRVFGHFHTLRVPVTYTVAGHLQRAHEMVFANYPLPARSV
jgi:DNA adenine methylase